MYNKIYIIGPVGSGKTTFASKLSKLYNITYYELDKVLWNDDEGNIKRTNEEAKNFEEEQERLQKEYEDYQETLYNKTQKYISSMTKKELVDELTYLLDYVPDWVYDDFIRRKDIE